jgi:hypothetical protein
MLGKLGGDPFHALCRSIVFQQLSVTVAGKIYKRVVVRLKGGCVREGRGGGERERERREREKERKR